MLAGSFQGDEGKEEVSQQTSNVIIKNYSGENQRQLCETAIVVEGGHIFNFHIAPADVGCHLCSLSSCPFCLHCH